MEKALTAEQFWCIALTRPKRLELPQWIQQQTKIQAIETAVMAEFESFRSKAVCYVSLIFLC
jgi:hypothetical protein